MVQNTLFGWMGGKRACNNSHQSLTSKQMFSTHEFWQRVTRLWQSCGSMIFIFCRGRWFSDTLRSIAKVSGHQKSALNNDNNWPSFHHICVNHPLWPVAGCYLCWAGFAASILEFYELECSLFKGVQRELIAKDFADFLHGNYLFN